MSYIWGHRGASGYAPENTLESFQLAMQQGADGIELDVQLTRDGKIVVCHDETIDRTSDHKGWVKDFTLAQLKKFNFNNHNPNYEFCHIPTLKEVLELIKPSQMVINIELKTGVFDYEGIEIKTLALVKEMDMENQVIYSSFNHYTMKKIRELKPNAYCAFLHCDKIIDIAEYASKYKMDALHPDKCFLLDEHYLKEAKEHGLRINSWTINEPEHIYLALKLGINAIITNYPDLALNLRKEFQNNN